MEICIDFSDDLVQWIRFGFVRIGTATVSSSASAFAARDDMSVLDDSEQNESNNGESYECAFIEKRCKRWDKVAPPRDHDLSLFVA